MRTPEIIASELNSLIRKDWEKGIWNGPEYFQAFKDAVEQERQHQAKLEAEVADLNRKLSNEIRRQVDTEAEASIKDMALRDLQEILCDPDGNPSFHGSYGDHDVARKAFESLSHPTPPLYSAVVKLAEATEQLIIDLGKLQIRGMSAPLHDLPLHFPSVSTDCGCPVHEHLAVAKEALDTIKNLIGKPGSKNV